MPDPLQIIEEDGVNFCLRASISISATITGNVEVENGFYGLPDWTKKVHPLEAVLIGHQAKSGDWKTDLTNVLRVTSVWLEGFIDGFAMADEASEGQEYVQGFLAAEELRQRRWRHLG